MNTASSRAPVPPPAAAEMAVRRTEVRAVDRLLGAYAAVTGAVLFLPTRPASWPVLALFHITLVWLALGGPGTVRLRAAFTRTVPRVAHFLREWYPILLIPLLYSELDTLNQTVHGGRMFDPIIIAAEEILFRGQPSREWAAAQPWLALSEPLHAAYLSYYLILYLPALLIWLRSTGDEFRRALFTILLAFLSHYLFFVFFPVEGPRYRFPAPTGGIEDGALYRLAHRLLEAGSSRGAAFPSSHVGASAAIAIATFRTLPRAGVVLFALTIGVALGATYGGFHYATDVVAGLILGTAVAIVAPAVYRRLEPPATRA